MGACDQQKHAPFFFPLQALKRPRVYAGPTAAKSEGE